MRMTQTRHTKPNSLPLENVNSSTGVFSQHFQENKTKPNQNPTNQSKLQYPRKRLRRLDGELRTQHANDYIQNILLIFFYLN